MSPIHRTRDHYNTLPHTATHCNTLQHTATHCNPLQHTATHCNILQHTATHCNTLQHTGLIHASRIARAHSDGGETSNSLQHTGNTLQHTCNTLQHTAIQCNAPALGTIPVTHCNIMQHTCNVPATHLQHAGDTSNGVLAQQSIGTD